MREDYSGVYKDDIDGTYVVWWRHTDGRPYDTIEGMTLEEVQEFAQKLIKSVEGLERERKLIEYEGRKGTVETISGAQMSEPIEYYHTILNDEKTHQWNWIENGKLQSAQCDQFGWIPIDTRLPPQGVEVLHCCWIDKHHGFSGPDIGTFNGDRTLGNTLVMEVFDDLGDFTPCDRWQPITLPKEP